ncbi:MAG: hypothetical protein N2042_03230 [Thermodesulfovibrio sp.]|nr:hypothetical protein [Thermodesulfovibrio sp.]MDW7972107.1 hypothetical protein [Thermodesulfovibrio sp.]
MQQEKKSTELEERARETFSAERREDYAVLVIATIVVLLVLLGIIDKKIISALYILKY